MLVVGNSTLYLLQCTSRDPKSVTAWHSRKHSYGSELNFVECSLPHPQWMMNSINNGYLLCKKILLKIKWPQEGLKFVLLFLK